MSVIAAFPATGKSYVAERDDRYADSDSSSFSWESPGVRHPDWPTNYIEHIKGLLADGKTVLCSTHQEVRDALSHAGIPFTLVYPAAYARHTYVERMKERGSDERLVGFIESNWHDLIESCGQQAGCEHAVLINGYLSDWLETSGPQTSREQR